MTPCDVCAELQAKLKRATETGDHSAATDCRVLLRRHVGTCPTGEAGKP